MSVYDIVNVQLSVSDQWYTYTLWQSLGIHWPGGQKVKGQGHTVTKTVTVARLLASGCCATADGLGLHVVWLPGFLVEIHILCDVIIKLTYLLTLYVYSRASLLFASGLNTLNNVVIFLLNSRAVCTIYGSAPECVRSVNVVDAFNEFRLRRTRVYTLVVWMGLLIYAHS